MEKMIENKVIAHLRISNKNWFNHPYIILKTPYADICGKSEWGVYEG